MVAALTRTIIRQRGSGRSRRRVGGKANTVRSLLVVMLLCVALLFFAAAWYWNQTAIFSTIVTVLQKPFFALYCPVIPDNAPIGMTTTATSSSSNTNQQQLQHGHHQ
jgi:hypothetical protein